MQRKSATSYQQRDDSWRRKAGQARSFLKQWNKKGAMAARHAIPPGQARCERNNTNSQYIQSKQASKANFIKMMWNLVCLSAVKALVFCFVKTTARGFEPLRAEPNGFIVHHLNHSVTLSWSAIGGVTSDCTSSNCVYVYVYVWT